MKQELAEAKEAEMERARQEHLEETAAEVERVKRELAAAEAEIEGEVRTH